MNFVFNSIKRLWTAISIMAVLNFLVLAGMSVYAWQHGWLEPARLRRAMAVLKGEEPPQLPSPTSQTTDSKQASPRSSERIRRNDQIEEQRRIELARRRREIKDGWKLLEVQQLALLQKREALEEKEKQFEARQEQIARKEGDSGVQRELEILSGIPPKAAKELLKQKDDAEVVRILLAMEARKANKIVKQCKTKQERLWIGRIMEKLHDRDASRAEVPGAGTKHTQGA